MTIIDRGSGIPVVLIPGIQGRWEWMQPAVEALSAVCRVITFSLADEPTSGAPFDEANGMDSYLRQVDGAMTTAGVQRAVVCGVSYGGLIAALFAVRYPTRVAGIALVSAIPPTWIPNSRTRFLMRAPRLLTPLFCVSSLRLLGEMIRAKQGWLSGIAFGLTYLWTVTRYPFHPTRMAGRVRLFDGLVLEPLTSMRAPAFVITGEPALDLVVPVDSTKDYLRLWPQARQTTLARTGHLGLVTRPTEFARLVATFAREATQEDEEKRRIG